MSFFWLILILMILIVAAIDVRTWAQWASVGFTDLGVHSFARPVSDLEIRAFYRKRACEHIPFVRPDDPIRFEDPTIDMLLSEGKFDEADGYRMRKMMEAREAKDIEAVETYAVYKAVISRYRALHDDRRRKSVRDRYPKIVETEKAAARGHWVSAESIEPPKKKRRQRIRSGFLEIEWKGLPKYALPQDSAGDPETAPDMDEAALAPDIADVPRPAPSKPDSDAEPSDDEYSGLISL